MIWYIRGLVVVGHRGSEFWSPVHYQVVVEIGGQKTFMVFEWSF